ncbi:MAG TPA: Rrf2 family transcriptional regulator [Myxococcota bacterium]|nr:Rrf2 family transcriptional regulator [Myxococcota bacterium]
MNLDRRLSSALHALLHMARHPGPVTSEELGRWLGANPVVVRRTMGPLRDAGLVRAEKGRGGGWSLQRDLAAIHLYDMHAALGEPSVFAVGLRNHRPECQVEQAVNRHLEATFAQAEALLMRQLQAISLAQLAAELHRPGCEAPPFLHSTTD